MEMIHIRLEDKHLVKNGRLINSLPLFFNLQFN